MSLDDCLTKYPQTLKTFLNEAYSAASVESQRLYIPTAENPPSNPQPSVPPVSPSTSTPFPSIAAKDFLASVSHPDVTTDVFIQLDTSTSKDGSTCRLFDWSRDDGYNTVVVRADFASAQVALDALLNGVSNMQRLQNEATTLGGVLRNYHHAKNDANQHGDVVEFKNKPFDALPWKTCCPPGFGDQGEIPLCLPVFCTADIPLQALNKFIERVYSVDYFPENFPQGVRIIDSLDLATLQDSHTRSPYTKPFGNPFLDKSPQAINLAVKSQFPSTKLNCCLFVILDSLSSTDQTCILATNHNDAQDPGLQLQRGDFWAVLGTLNAFTCTSLMIATCTATAAESSDGVFRDGPMSR